LILPLRHYFIIYYCRLPLSLSFSDADTPFTFATPLMPLSLFFLFFELPLIFRRHFRYATLIYFILIILMSRHYCRLFALMMLIFRR